MSPDVAQYLAGQGGLGAAILVLAGVVALLYRAKDACEAERHREGREMAAALERNSAMNAALTAALEARTRATQELARAVLDLTRRSDVQDERLREKLDDILRWIRPEP